MALDLKERVSAMFAAPTIERPVIPNTFPGMPAPRRNVCWALREMRDKFQRGVVRWIRHRTYDGGGGYCLIGLAQKVANNDVRLYHATVYQLSRAIMERSGQTMADVTPLGPDTIVPRWNDNGALDTDDVCRIIARAEEMAERDGYCEP